MELEKRPFIFKRKFLHEVFKMYDRFIIPNRGKGLQFYNIEKISAGILLRFFYDYPKLTISQNGHF